MEPSITENRSPKSVMQRWRRAGLLVLILVAMVAGFGVWLTASTSGLRWAGSTVSHLSNGQVSIEGLDGTLMRSVTARTVRLASGDLLVVGQAVTLNWQPGSLKSGLLEITYLAMEDLEIISPPSSEPRSLPQTLELPVGVRLHKLDIGALRVLPAEGGKPDFAATQLAASFFSDGSHHRVPQLRVRLDFGALAASGEIAGTEPFSLSARMELEGLALPGATQAQQSRISAIVRGSLGQLDVRAGGEGGGLTGEAQAQLRPYDPLKIARLRMAVNGLDPHAFSPAAPEARLDLEADLRENTAGELEGRLSGKNRGARPLDQGGLPLLEMDADALISAELLQLDDLLLALPNGGKITGNVSWRHKRGSASGNLRVIGLDPARLDTRLRTGGINGTMKLSGNAKRQEGILALTDKNLKLDVTLAKDAETLSLEKLHLRHGRAAVLTGSGKLGLDVPRSFNFEGSLQHFDVSAFLQVPRTSLNATLKVAGELESPSAAGPAAKVDFRMGNSQIAEHAVTGDGRIEFSGRDLATARGSGEVELRLGLNQLVARGGIGHKGDQLLLSLVAPKLAQIGLGLRGSLDAEVVMQTGVTDFGRRGQKLPDIRFSAEGKSLSFRGDHKLAAFSANGSLRGEEIALTASLKDYGTAQKTVLQTLELEMRGLSREHELVSTARLGENQNLDLKISGGLHESPQKLQGWRDVRWTGKLAELSGNGQFTFRMKDSAPLEVAANHLSLGTTSIAIAGGNININRIVWTPQTWNSKGDFSRIGLRPRTSQMERGGGGEAEAAEEREQMLRLGGEWDISSAAQLSGAVRVARESGDWVLPGEPPFSLGLQTLEMSARAGDRKVAGELKAQGKRLGLVSASVAVPITRSDDSVLKWTVVPEAPLSGSILVNMEDISWAGAAFGNDNNLRTGGQLALQSDVVGTLHQPRLQGRIRGDNLAVALLDQGVWLEHGTLAAHFDQESVHMDALHFSAPHQPMPKDSLLKNVKLEKGPGTLRAAGDIDLTGQRGNLEITASLLPLAQRPDRWIIASGNGRATLENNMLTLRGALAADAGLLTQPTAGRPHLPDDVVVIGKDTNGAAQPDRKGLRIDVEARLDLGERFYIRASGLQGRLDGELQLRGEPGRPLRATGTIAARDTKFEAYGQNLVVERGIVNFQGPIDDPALNVLALRKGLPVEAGVEVTGTVRLPKVRLVSTPNVPDMEKLSWIALGRAPGGKTDASLLLAAASSIMGGQAGGVMEKISRTIGVDELSIRQSGIDPLMGQVGVIGKRLSDRAYITYEQGLMAVAGVTKLTYNLTPKITVVTRAGLDNAIDLLYTLRFD
ncbi:translocation/assembly module TamB domain-containing protein [Nitrosospira sp. Is2]|uniref:translocation/assembly module TamB domain-containing protein n=1 Tax=Nitrosospira sp. Is2 TaxID=3080532 RepID=UPI0029557953|nr:translocation/assembly module TamB domain-containing protein [Nitrosospira sp. Is2]WON74349.1 translocation/assembly module TamB domain-containing protein [Nitrosospira sp. Is2]